MESYFERCLSGRGFEGHEDKQYEFQRLLSFKEFPEECPVFPIRLAQAGFYYCGEGDKVKCFCCGVEKDGWQAGDRPRDIHFNLQPDCAFLSGGESGNVPIGVGSSILSNGLGETADSQNRFSTPLNSVSSQSGSEGLNSLRSNDSSPSVDRLTQILSSIELEGTSNIRIPNSENTSSDTTNLNTDQNSLESDHPSGNRSAPSSLRNMASNPRFNSSHSVDLNAPDSMRVSEVQITVGTPQGNPQTPGRGSGDIAPPTGEGVGPMRYERNRLATFNNWPQTAAVTPAVLARSGFVYTGAGDRVQCIFCKGILRNWDPGDIPHIEHRRHFPRCPLILGLNIGNVPIPPDQTASQRNQNPRNQSLPVMTTLDSSVSMEALGINTYTPKHPQYAIEATRVASFKNWPGYKHQTPQILAKAGFFYAGFNDNVKCFFCDGGLRNWEPGDDPWREHARWFPQCPFVKQCKGEVYIKEVQARKHTGPPILSQSSNTIPGTSGSQPRVRLVDDREVRARMDRPYVQAALNMGYSRETLMKTVRKRLEETGDDFPNAESFLEAVFMMEEHLKSSRSAQNSLDLQGPSQGQQIQGGVPQTPQQGQEVDTQTGQWNSPAPAPSPAPGTSEITENSGEKTSVSGPLDDLSDQEKEDGDSLRKENQQLKEQRLCKICLVDEVNVVFLPCGHLVSCSSCAPALRQCPICRANIKGTVRTYLS